jgi:hypothetical protein
MSLAGACLTGTEEGLEFPSYVQASALLPAPITAAPVFSSGGNYALAAAGDTLYHMELVHGRTHGKTAMGDVVTHLVSSSSGVVFAVSGQRLCRIEGFEIAVQVQLPLDCTDLSVCGVNPVLLMADGSIVLRSATDLSVLEEVMPAMEGITFIEGFSEMLCSASQGGVITTFSIPGFTETARNTLSGSVSFLSSSGSSLLFGSDQWNEVAVCSPADLIILEMFTFSETPVAAFSAGSLTVVYAVLPNKGVQVCRRNGDIPWISSDYGPETLIEIADNLETALFARGSRLDILVR